MSRHDRHGSRDDYDSDEDEFYRSRGRGGGSREGASDFLTVGTAASHGRSRSRDDRSDLLNVGRARHERSRSRDDRYGDSGDGNVDYFYGDDNRFMEVDYDPEDLNDDHASSRNRSGSSAGDRSGTRVARVSVVGWQPDMFDERDQYYYIDRSIRVKNYVNLRDKYPSFKVRVYDQGNLQSCVANAMSVGFRYCQYIQYSKDVVSPSRLFLYWNGRTIRQVGTSRRVDVKDTGCVIRDAMKGLKTFGVCSERDWPYYEEYVNVSPGDWRDRYDPRYAEAYDHRSQVFLRLDPDHTAEKELRLSRDEKERAGRILLRRLRQCLSEGYPVVFGIRWYFEPDEANWRMSKSTGLKQVRDYPQDRWQKPPRKELGGHAIIAVGYDDEYERVLCQNSWGTKWSPGGLFWCGYDWIQQYHATADFWTLRLIEDRR